MAETNTASCDDILSSSHAQAKLQASNTIQKKLKATLFALLCERNTRCKRWNISAKSLCQILSICINESTQMKRPQRFRILRLRSVSNKHEHQREIELNTGVVGHALLQVSIMINRTNKMRKCFALHNYFFSCKALSWNCHHSANKSCANDSLWHAPLRICFLPRA